MTIRWKAVEQYLTITVMPFGLVLHLVWSGVKVLRKDSISGQPLVLRCKMIVYYAGIQSSETDSIYFSLRQDFDQQPVSASTVVVPGQYDKPPLLQSNQSEPCYQQPFTNRSCATSASVPAILTRGVDLTQHMTSSYGIHQAHNHISNISTQRLLHTGIHQDQALLGQIQPRQADYIPGQAAVVPGQNSGMANQIYPGHFNQGHVFHNVSSSDPYRPNTMPQHFIPVNPPPLYPSTLMPNPASFRASNIAASKTDPLPSTQEPPLESSGKTVGSPAYMISGELGSKDMKITLLSDDLSKHSSKERVRR